MECFTVPADRLLVNLERFKAGRGCRAVGVTTFSLVKKDVPMQPANRLSNLNSVLYTPVLQWFDIDVKKQVPKYLPMNLWPGSYTVFGFYEPENMGNIHVTLSGRIMQEEVYLEESMNTKRSLSAEEWSILSRTLERELQKNHPELAVPSVPPPNPRLETLKEVTPRRVSQDTDYQSSHKHDAKFSTSRQQTPYSALRYSQSTMSATSDSEDGTFKEATKNLKEKQGKLRRKDTPSHHYATSKITKHFGTYKKQANQFMLEEEGESSGINDADDARIANVFMVTSSTNNKIVDQKLTPLTIEDDLRVPHRLTKSCEELKMLKEVNIDSESHNTSFPTVKKGEQESPYRKKKRSIASKVANFVSNGGGKNSSVNTTETPKSVDHGDEADDEFELSISEGSKSKTTKEKMAECSADSTKREVTRKSDESPHIPSVNIELDTANKTTEIKRKDDCPGNIDSDKRTEIIEGVSVEIKEGNHGMQLESDNGIVEHRPEIKEYTMAVEEIVRPHSSLSFISDTYSGISESENEEKRIVSAKRKKNPGSNKTSPEENTSLDTTKTVVSERAIIGESHIQSRAKGAVQKVAIQSKDTQSQMGAESSEENEENQKAVQEISTGTLAQKHSLQHVTVMNQVLKAMASDSGRGKQDKSSDNIEAMKKSVDITEKSATSKSNFKENMEKQYSYSDITETQKQKRHSQSKSIQGLKSSTETIAERMDVTVDKVKHSTLLKTQSVAKLNMHGRRKITENVYTSKHPKSYECDVASRPSRTKPYGKETETATANTGGMRAYSKSFSSVTIRNAQLDGKRRGRQSLEITNAVSSEDRSDTRSVSKPIHAFGDTKKS